MFALATSAYAQGFACRTTNDCDFWVAASGPGDELSYFKRSGRRIKIGMIALGDVIAADRAINVRSEAPPAGWDDKAKLFALRTDQTVKILEIKSVPGGGGQTWLRITRPDMDLPAKPSPVATEPTARASPDADIPSQGPESCFELPIANEVTGPVPVIEPPTSHPPKPSDLQRLFHGRPIFCDQYGLIVHKNPNGTFDGGDTMAREGWYWLGVWIREHELGEQPMPKRKLNFDQVIQLLDPASNGIFLRHPKQAPFNKGIDKDWGTSRDQIVPMVAAMGVWDKQEDIRRLWDALPEDIQGRHAFNGNWRNALGQDGPNCYELKDVSCSPTKQCPAETDPTTCPAEPDTSSCSAETDTSDCHRERCILTRPWDGGCAQTVAYNDTVCELAKGTGNASSKLACEAQKSAGNLSSKATCEAKKAIANASQKAACEAQKEANRIGCEAKKVAEYNICRFTNIFNGDLIGPATVNLFLRAMNHNPLQPDLDNLLPFTFIPGQGVSKGGIDGELELLTNTHLIVGKANDDHDAVDPDINHIVNLLMAKLRFPSFVSDNATQEYFSQRAHSFGSYWGAYYAQYGDDMTDYQERIIDGIGRGWKPDVSAVMGAVRWYHRPNTASGRPNPQLAWMYLKIIEQYLKP